MLREEAIADFKEEVENGKSIVRAYKNNGLTIKNVERTIERDEMAISALSEELSEDGTLTVHVSDGSKVNRVFVMGDNIFGGLYYPDSAENKGEWIPVTERLPENNDDVLVYDGSDIFVAWYSGIDLNWCSADNRFDEYTPIVAWQPLPEPYKKGGDT